MKIVAPPRAASQVALADIAAAVGISYRGVAFRAVREGWIFDEVAVLGGKKRFYPLASLPKEVANAVHIHAMGCVEVAPPAEPAPVPAPYSAPVAIDPHSLTTHQLEVERARDRIFAFVDGYHGSTKGALAWLNDEKAAGTLTGPMLWAYERAWDKPRAANKLGAKTYYNWVAEKKLRGRAAPLKIQKDMSVKPWHALAVALKQRPQGSMLVWIAEEIARQWNPAWGNDVPTKRALGYFLNEKFSALELLKGRHNGSALRAHMHYTKRSSAGMRPWDEIHADGWNTHFTAPHKVTGEFVTYEVWHAHDVATRFVPPFGLGYTENFDVIAACIENTIRCYGVPVILQTDSTAIVKKSERLKTNPATSLADRAGFTIVHPQEVGNSQANGIAENFNKYLDRCSRELATYQAKDMDSLALKRVKKLTGKMVAAAARGETAEYSKLKLETERMGKGRVFGSYAEAVEWLDEKRVAFNNRPHSSLPKMRDPETGRMRHQSPAEALDAHRTEGWEPVMVDETHLIDMFWQHVQKKVVRQRVSPYGKMVFHDKILADWEGKQVVVAFSDRDDTRVWIKTLDGEIICEAQRTYESAYRSQTAFDAGEEKRALSVIKRLEKKTEAVRNRIGGLIIENEGDMVDEPRMKSIADFVDVDARPVETALLTAADFLPEPVETQERSWSREETNRWLHGETEEDGKAQEKQSAAA